jgi:hypothetical protein
VSIVCETAIMLFQWSIFEDQYVVQINDPNSFKFSYGRRLKNEMPAAQIVPLFNVFKRRDQTIAFMAVRLSFSWLVSFHFSLLYFDLGSFLLLLLLNCI